MVDKFRWTQVRNEQLITNNAFCFGFVTYQSFDKLVEIPSNYLVLYENEAETR